MMKDASRIGKFPKAVTVPVYTETNMAYWKYRFAAELKTEYVQYIELNILEEGDPRQEHDMFKDYPKLGKEPFTDVKSYCRKLQWQRTQDVQALVPPTLNPEVREEALKHEKAGRLLRALAWLFEEAETMTGKGEVANRDTVKEIKQDIRALILNAMSFILAAFVGTHRIAERGDATVKPFFTQYGRWIYREWVFLKLLCSETVRHQRERTERRAKSQTETRPSAQCEKKSNTRWVYSEMSTEECVCTLSGATQLRRRQRGVRLL